MGTGWRRAFCTTIPRDGENQRGYQNHSPSPCPRTCAKLGLFPSISNPSTPRLQNMNPSTQRLQSHPDPSPNLRCRTTDAATVLPASADNSPRLRCKTNEKKSRSPRGKLGWSQSSPRSPFSILKNTLRLSRNGCGVCSQSVKTGQGMAIYTAECSHAFHFPCIAAHVRREGSLICPVCHVTWKDVPLLSAHKNPLPPEERDVVEKTIASTVASNPSTLTGVRRINFVDKKIQSTISAVKTKQDQYKAMTERAYNDDEPLVSPTAGARFNSIPEAAEYVGEDENSEDAEEFQGFFVNPTPSSSTKNINLYDHDRGTQRNVEVKLLPGAAVVSVDRTHETFAVALRVKAPPAPPAQGTAVAPLLSRSHRAPIDLVTVLDVSGSMTGAKLQMLKRAMRLIISALGSTDRLSIVAFSATPQRLLPLRRMTAHGQLSARHIIDHLACGQGTSVSEALRTAAKVLEHRREKNPVATIMLLSDGQDERFQDGTTNQRRALSHASSTRFAHLEIPVHSFGYSHEPAEDAFAKCVGGLLSVVVQDLRIQIGFTSGPAPAEITAVYCCNGRPTLLSCDSIRLRDLYAEEEKELLIELKVPTSAMRSHHVMSVRCNYRDPSTQELISCRERALLVPLPNAVGSTDPRNERLRNLFIATRAVAESRRLAEHSDFSSAHHLLWSARALLMKSASSSDEFVKRLEAAAAELNWIRQYQLQQQEVLRHREEAFVDENNEPLTPTSAWRVAERLAKVAIMKKSFNRVSDLHGFENARF
ncbi:hypothetical protein Nepgr_005078 [Nepenthes gracilis]|uniref:Uncharacterized protein n=1 Tax=Nepenthes gracilis TaxID=150966 RepID=A0AAD3XFW2_NEPGR|nr:hypothetical protein Nepgr_005078 [Nepenthes gracilis]